MKVCGGGGNGFMVVAETRQVVPNMLVFIAQISVIMKKLFEEFLLFFDSIVNRIVCTF